MMREYFKIGNVLSYIILDSLLFMCKICVPALSMAYLGIIDDIYYIPYILQMRTKPNYTWIQFYKFFFFFEWFQFYKFFSTRSKKLFFKGRLEIGRDFDDDMIILATMDYHTDVNKSPKIED